MQGYGSCMGGSVHHHLLVGWSGGTRDRRWMEGCWDQVGGEETAGYYEGIRCRKHGDILAYVGVYDPDHIPGSTRGIPPLESPHWQRFPPWEML